MNRQQRRAQSKGSHQRGVNKAVAWSRIKAKLFCASTDPNTQSETVEVLQTVYASILRLKNGLFDSDDFEQLNLIIAFGYELAGDISRAGDGQTKQILAPGESILMHCTDALLAMGTRFNKVNKFGATGDELQAIAEAIAFIEQVMNVATRGLVLSALMRAEARVQTVLAKTAMTLGKAKQ